jgi:hypothetical protein
MENERSESVGATRLAYNCDYGRIYRNATIAELRDGKAARVTDYWGEPTETAAWRGPLTARLEMAPDGIWPDGVHLKHR